MPPKGEKQESAPKVSKPSREKKSSFFADYKYTIITNSVLVGIIGYLIFKNMESNGYSDCSAYFRMGFRADGIYEIKTSPSAEPVNVYCDMSAGGWTVLMKRHAEAKSPIDFNLESRVYKYGFGDLNGDHFLGLEHFHALTKSKQRELKVVMNQSEYRYKNFRVLNEYFNYKLIVEEEIDTMPDECSFARLNNTLFSTIDVDFDLAINSNCSSGWKAGWWFTDCFDRSTCLTCLIAHGTKGVKKLNYAAMLIK